MADGKTANLLTELGIEDLYGFLGVQPDDTEKEVGWLVWNRSYIHVYMYLKSMVERVCGFGDLASLRSFPTRLTERIGRKR